MKINIKVICKINRLYKNNTAPLFIRLTQVKEVRLISTGVSANPSHWDNKAQMLTSDCPERESLQQKIDAKLEALNKQIAKLEILDMEVTLDALTGSKSKQINPAIKEYFESHINHLKQSGKVNAAIKYKFTLSSLLKYCGGETKIASIDKAFLVGFEQFLSGVGNAGNSIATKMSVLKALYNKALKDGVPVMNEHPFLDYKIGKLITPTRKRALTKDMVKRLADLELPKSLSPYQELSRDIFLFSYYTAGINFKDIALLKYRDIEEGRICYRRRKTRKVINCLLIEPAKMILDKYTHTSHSPDDYIFPILQKGVHVTEQQINDRVHKSLVRVNRFLKRMSEQLGLSTPITTYVARHSYATVLKRSGVNIAIISESLGHSDISTTQIYLDSFENSQIDEAMKHLL